MIKNYKAIVEYDGSFFYGWQRLNHKRTVQKEIEKAFKKVCSEKVKIHGSGRTDAKAHATGQVISFKIDLKVPLARMADVLNKNLPDDIYIRDIEKVSLDFHARFSAKSKRYRYKVYTTQYKKVLLNHYYCHYPYEIDIHRMVKAKAFLIGEQDFRSFTAKSSLKENTVRRIDSVEIVKKDDEIDFIIEGNGFLYKMIRTIVGNLLAVGRGQISVDEFKKIILEKDIKKAKDTVPAKGLYLEKVFY